jgi:hypothetical protein
MMQAQIPQELSALMALSQGMQQGRVAPTTPEGAPTIAAQKMGQVEQSMMPGMQQALGQAGLGGQIQAMQMQEAQKAMMNAAMQQARPPAGIERLNPQMGNFAQGGIVGYAAGDLAEEEYDRRLREAERSGKFRQTILGGSRSRVPEGMGADERGRLLEVIAASTPQMPIPEVEVQEDRPPPSPPSQPSESAAAASLGIVAPLYEKQREEYAKIKTAPLTQEELLAQAKNEREVRRQMLIQSGLDPDYLDKREAQGKSLFEQQQALLRERMDRERGKDTFLGRMGEALRGFSQMKGQGVGPGILRSNEALERRLASGEARMDQMRDLEIKINELDMIRRNALEDARHAIATGDFNRAQERLAAARNAENDKAKLIGGTYGPQASAAVQERQVSELGKQRMQNVQTQEFARLQGIASTYEARKVEALRKLDENFAKDNKLLLQQEQMLKDKMPANQQQALEKAKDAHRMNRASVAKQFDDRLAMINSRLYPGVDFSVGTPSSSPDIQAARKIVAGSK